MGPELESAYTTASNKLFWPLVSAHLVAASPFMLATHNRNLDDDCQAIPVLAHAPITTDTVESQFATYDYALRLGAGFGATAGVAHATWLHTMETPGAKRAKAGAKVQAKRKRGIGTGTTEAEQISEQIAKWDTTSFFSLSPDKRWSIIVSVRNNYKDTANSELELLRKMDEAKAERQKEAKQAIINKAINRALKFAQFSGVPIIASLPALQALVEQHDGNASGLAEALRQQIRVRKHVYATPPSSEQLPYIGAKPGDSEEKEASRLVEAFKLIVVKPLPLKLPPPTPYPLREATAAPTVRAKELDAAHLKHVAAAWRDLIVLLDGSPVFNVPKSKAKTSRARAKAKPAGAQLAPAPKPKTVPKQKAAPKAKAAKVPAAADRALEGEEFEEDGVDWRVLSVRWSSSTEEVVVWYYDVVEAEASGVSEEGMSEAIESGESCDCLEYSSVKEIRRWIKGEA
jgi:hypothetical protein